MQIFTRQVGSPVANRILEHALYHRCQDALSLVGILYLRWKDARSVNDDFYFRAFGEVTRLTGDKCSALIDRSQSLSHSIPHCFWDSALAGSRLIPFPHQSFQPCLNVTP